MAQVRDLDWARLGARWKQDNFSRVISLVTILPDGSNGPVFWTFDENWMLALHESAFIAFSYKARADFDATGCITHNTVLQSPDSGGKEHSMLEHLIRMYNAAMRHNVRSVIPHLVGPPGVGKSEVMEKLALHAGVTLHTVNVSRLSPLEIEGVQMPHGEGTEMKLQLLLNTLWAKLEEGDIVLFDEFLRGFPEVYNGLLDIITSRKVAGHTLPKVFFVAASNSVATYDRALEDRLLHIMVPDLRSSMAARNAAKELLAREIGLIHDVVKSSEMDELFTQVVLPTYKMLDFFQGKASLGQVATIEGKSIRNLVGQAQLRELQTSHLKDLIVLNNQLAISQRKWQYVVLLDGKNVDPKYVSGARKLLGNPALTEVQANNLAFNLDLVEIEEALKETLNTTTEEVTEDEVF
jgi:hypothetical protein